MRNHRLRSSQSAWTLLEMLLAVVVVMILALISFASFKQLIRRAEAAQCVSNLRQAGSAFLLYTGEQNKNVIRSQMGGANIQKGWSRLMANAGYAGAQPWKILMCPSAKVPPSAKTSTTKYNHASPNLAAGDTWRWYTYGLNTCRIAGKTTESTVEETPGGANVRMFELPMAQIDHPSTHVLLADSCANTGYACEHMERDNPRGLGLWHGSGKNRYANAVFVDGHVEGITKERAAELGEGLNLPATYIYSPAED